MSELFTREELEQAVDAARRLERIHQAIHLWGLMEFSEVGPSSDYERGADMAYKNAAAYLLADVSRGANAGINVGFDLVADPDFVPLESLPELVELAQGMTAITTEKRTGEVDRALQAARDAREAVAELRRRILVGDGQ